MRDELDINTKLFNFKVHKTDFDASQHLSSSTKLRRYTINLAYIFLYSLVFSLFYTLSHITFRFDSHYLISLSLFIISIIFGSSLSGKFKLTRKDETNKIIKTLYSSIFLSLVFLIFFFLFQDINRITRIYILSAAFCSLLLELLYFILLSNSGQNKISSIRQIKLPVGYILMDGIILSVFCYFEVVLNIVPFADNKTEILLLILIFISWIVSAAITHKFIPAKVSSSRMNAFELQVKFYLAIIILSVLSMFFLQLEFSNAINFAKALAGYALVSSLLSIVLFAQKIKNQSDESTVVFLKAYEMNDSINRSNGKVRNGRYSYSNTEVADTNDSEQKIDFEYLKNYGNVFSILDTIIDLKTFDTRNTLILDTDQPIDKSNQDKNNYQLLVNLHVLNDQIKLNDFLLDVRNLLLDKGVFVGALLPHHYRYRRYLKKYSFYLANLLYFFDFMWKRVMPKLPITREIYFTFSKDKDRAISLAEGLGRLVYCGFKILDLVVVDDVVYFAAAKNGSFNPDKKFFYSPIFKMKRVGKNGKPIYVYKFRTMYPYSEFIQDFIYNQNKLEAGGKFKNDFRVPAWGRLFRKLWIDELPMLVNWLKGDVKFVGVRPISNQYLSLYSKDHQERRKNFKPGLIPPYYADMPKTIEEIELSEKRYLDAYEKNPFKTDIRYFIKAVDNILIKKKRSA